MPQYLSRLLKDPNVSEADKPIIKELRDALKSKKILPTDLLQYRFIFQKYGSFHQFNADYLVKLSHFMSHEPVTGLTILNRVVKLPGNLIYKLTKKRVPIPELKYDTNKWLAMYSKYFIIRDLNLLFSRLRNED